MTMKEQGVERTFAKDQTSIQQTATVNSTTQGTGFSGQNRSAASILRLQGTIGNHAVQRLLQPKLAINAPGDVYEREADRVAAQVMRMPLPTHACDCGGECAACKARESIRNNNLVQTRRVNATGMSVAPPAVEGVLRSPGKSIDEHARAYFEPRFGLDFSQVRVHTDEKAAESAHAIHAHAYTSGQNMVFGVGRYAPRTTSGRQLLAHELAHVAQQGGASRDRAQLRTHSSTGAPHIQRTLGDGHDLSSPRFSLILDLEAAFDGEMVIRAGSQGRGVQAIQQALYDLGHSLPAHGADGDYRAETKAAVKKFQRANPPLVDDGEVGELTMAVLNSRFASAPALPSAAVLSGPWNPACVCSVLCPWSPHTVDVLKSRITVKSFDSISWADEAWDGAAWIAAPFPGGGYHKRSIREIGVLNASCESVSETLYHEVLHAEQPTTHRTTLRDESYAYRIGEEFSIAMGLGGRSDLRSTDAQGREFADRAKVEAFVSTEYPSVAAGGTGEQIIGKAATLGEVRVRRANGTIYTRRAAVGEKVPGPMSISHEVTHPNTAWNCP